MLGLTLMLRDRHDMDDRPVFAITCIQSSREVLRNSKMPQDRATAENLEFSAVQHQREVCVLPKVSRYSMKPKNISRLSPFSNARCSLRTDKPIGCGWLANTLRQRNQRGFRSAILGLFWGRVSHDRQFEGSVANECGRSTEISDVPPHSISQHL